MFCQNCGNQIDNNAAFCTKCGTPVQQPVQQTRVVVTSSDDAALRMLVPVGRSGLAIAAGYLGIVALFIPFSGIIAFILGILALRDLSNNPDKHGHGRAWFAIIAGILSVLLWTCIVANS
jgi:hypothetical protein